MQFRVLLLILQFLSIFGAKDFLQQELSYDQKVALKLWKYDVISYCNQENIKNWNCGPLCEEFQGVSDITVMYDSGLDILGLGFVFQNEVFIVFRGTVPISWKNIYDDINFFSVKFDFCDGCEGHRGFLQSFNSVKPQFDDFVNKMITKYPNINFTISGHSLGAAIANHAAIHLIKDFPQVRLTYFYTFGQPRTGNQNFSIWFTELAKNLNINIARVSHKRDPFVHLPLNLMEYQHFAHEIFYQQDQVNYKVCQGYEDKTCADQYSIYNLLDHLDYLGVNQFEYMLSHVCNPKSPLRVL